jgi:hypothetical protein
MTHANPFKPSFFVSLFFACLGLVELFRAPALAGFFGDQKNLFSRRNDLAGSAQIRSSSASLDIPNDQRKH